MDLECLLPYHLFIYFIMKGGEQGEQGLSSLLGDGPVALAEFLRMGMGKWRKTMKAATRDKKSRWYIHMLVLSAALAGMALVLMICQATPTKAATMEEKLSDFLKGPPFEFGFDKLQVAGEAAKTEALKPILGLPSRQSTEPTLEQIKEFAETVQGDTYAFPEEVAPKYARSGRLRP
jgi:hypothetical protein